MENVKIFRAIIEGNDAQFLEELKALENINMVDSKGDSLLHYCVLYSRINYIKELIEREANSKLKNNHQQSPLALAIAKENERMIGLLSEPEFVYYNAWTQIAEAFDYKINEHDQDWTYTIAEPDHIDQYLEVYDTLSEVPQKFSLMEIIIQATNDQSDEDFEYYWEKLEILLDQDFEIHQVTIYYWCDWMNDDIEDCFMISSKMRSYWINKIKG